MAKKNSGSFLDKAVKFVAIYFVSFVSIMIITFWFKGSVPDSLIPYALGGGIVELAGTTVIEALKKKYENAPKAKKKG